MIITNPSGAVCSRFASGFRGASGDTCVCISIYTYICIHTLCYIMLYNITLHYIISYHTIRSVSIGGSAGIRRGADNSARSYGAQTTILLLLLLLIVLSQLLVMIVIHTINIIIIISIIIIIIIIISIIIIIIKSAAVP